MLVVEKHSPLNDKKRYMCMSFSSRTPKRLQYRTGYGVLDALPSVNKLFTILNLNTLASQQVIYLLISELLDYYWWQLLEESLN